ncbi:helix-turn-helix domain-containing protein [Rhizobium leguminosarum]|uniref:helix-turn-helix transcriptional regulator n=2 Tax=Rhizobium leguminosarum TaxID=384 RepID=UPI0028C41771|nr:helix-turn-helix domain-containing protein [Rhizobium leguminosarum]
MPRGRPPVEFVYFKTRRCWPASMLLSRNQLKSKWQFRLRLVRRCWHDIRNERSGDVNRHFCGVPQSVERIDMDKGGMECVPSLSPREKECLLWIAQGKTSWETAVIMGISENTVAFHVKNCLRKLDVRTRTAAVATATRFGLLEL